MFSLINLIVVNIADTQKWVKDEVTSRCHIAQIPKKRLEVLQADAGSYNTATNDWNQQIMQPEQPSMFRLFTMEAWPDRNHLFSVYDSQPNGRLILC